MRTSNRNFVIPSGPPEESDLKWRKQPMVRWLSPDQLTATGIRALLSTVFGAYADRREVQAALHQAVETSEGDSEHAPTDGVVYKYDQRTSENGFWIDFVADLGDGFDSTYSIAWLLSRPTLPAKKGQPETCRGDLLIMGGDQVYPTASRDEYANRMVGPYESAFPWSLNLPPAHLYALPGNHDWYDGLTAFLRLFCQQRWIGGWKTQQRRSYFALQLPNRWWLLGLDAQLESDIDQPQREYFLKVAAQMNKGDRVILCTPEPAWVHTPTDPAAFDMLWFFEKSILAPRGVDVALTLTGDLHHYARYSDTKRADAKKHHKITAGGGGAYLLGTQLLAGELELDDPVAVVASSPARVSAAHRKGRPKEKFQREKVYPSSFWSTFLKWGAVTLVFKNPSFGFFLGFMYAMFAWLIQSSSKLSLLLKKPLSDPNATDLMTFAQGRPAGDWLEIFKVCWAAAAHAPLVVAFALLIIGGLIAFCRPDVQRSRILRSSRKLQTLVRVTVGAVQGVLHLALAVGMIWFFSWFNLSYLHMQVDSVRQATLFLFEMASVGGVLGAILLSLFLLPGLNYNEAFSAQHLETYKNFVRMHIAADGTLTIYPYGVDHPARWNFVPNAPPGDPYYKSDKPPKAHIIDGPIVLAAPAS